MSSHFGLPVIARRRWLRLQLGVVVSALFLVTVLAAPTDAAASPQAATNCSGSLTRAPTTDEPNLLNYKFHCDWGITAYTVVINRKLNDFSTIDDFSTTGLIYDTAGKVVPNPSFTCEGNIPGNGVNCNAGGAYMSAPDYAQGSFDPAYPYCANVPSGSPAGTKPLPQAMVQLVVTDTTGAQDGPFRLSLPRACPAPKVVSVKKGKTHRHHRKHGQRA
jgi:hypothetical protein